MSHSQFHCTGRVYLDLHGLIFETSICYWQDQPGSPEARGGGGGGASEGPGGPSARALAPQRVELRGGHHRSGPVGDPRGLDVCGGVNGQRCGAGEMTVSSRRVDRRLSGTRPGCWPRTRRRAPWSGNWGRRGVSVSPLRARTPALGSWEEPGAQAALLSAGPQ